MTRTAITTVVLCLSFNGCEAAYAADTLNKTFNLGAAPQVEVGNINGPVTVTGGARSTVFLSAVKSGGSAADRDRLKIEVEVDGDALRVTTRCDRWIRGCGRGVKVRYTLHVPRGTRLSARSVNGPVTVSGVQGEVKARSVNGRVRTSDTGSASVRVRTVNGKIEVRGHAGEVRARTVNGKIELRLRKLARDVRLRTVSGTARVLIPRGSGARVDMRTVSGELTSELPMQVSRRGRRGLNGTLGNGGPQIKARTVSGGVKILAL